MLDSFDSAVEALWRIVGFNEPMFDAYGAASLYFDDVLLKLTESPSGREVLISSNSDVISKAMQLHTDALQKTLELSFAFLATHNVLVSLKSEQLVVVGIYPLEKQDMSHFSDILIDVVSVVQTLEQHLADRISTVSDRGSLRHFDTDDTVYLKP